MVSEREINITVNKRQVFIITLLLAVFITLGYTYIISLMAFIAPSQDSPLRFYQVSSLDENNTPASSFSKGDLVRINATVEMATGYIFISDYIDFTGPVTFRAILSIYDPNNMPVIFRRYQHTIYMGNFKNELYNYTIALDAVSGSYTARLMLWSDWLPSGTPLTLTAEEVTFSVS